MRKLAASIVYFLFFIPTFVGSIAFAAFSERAFGFMFPGTGEIEALIGLVIFGGVFFWIGSKIVTGFQIIEAKTFSNHFYQSLIFYILLVYLLISIINSYKTWGGSLYFGYLVVSAMISLWAIIVNGFYWYLKKTKNL